MRIVIGADHAGFSLKEILSKYLGNLDYELIDVGTINTDSVDYPDYAEKVGVVAWVHPWL